jgi:hypothetical protein
MQATAKSGSGQTALADDNDSEYVGKHRPHRMALLRPRVRVGQLADRGTPESK